MQEIFMHVSKKCAKQLMKKMKIKLANLKNLNETIVTDHTFC